MGTDNNKTKAKQQLTMQIGWNYIDCCCSLKNFKKHVGQPNSFTCLGDEDWQNQAEFKTWYSWMQVMCFFSMSFGRGHVLTEVLLWLDAQGLFWENPHNVASSWSSAFHTFPLLCLSFPNLVLAPSFGEGGSQNGFACLVDGEACISAGPAHLASALPWLPPTPSQQRLGEGAFKKLTIDISLTTALQWSICYLLWIPSLNFQGSMTEKCLSPAWCSG